MNISDEDIHNSEGGVALNPFVSFLMAPFYFLAPQWYLRVDAFFCFQLKTMSCPLLLSKWLSTLPLDMAWWFVLFCSVSGSPSLNSPQGRKLSTGKVKSGKNQQGWGDACVGRQPSQAWGWHLDLRCEPLTYGKFKYTVSNFSTASKAKCC